MIRRHRAALKHGERGIPVEPRKHWPVKKPHYRKGTGDWASAPHLRLLEWEGIIPAARRDFNGRLYSEFDIALLQRIGVGSHSKRLKPRRCVGLKMNNALINYVVAQDAPGEPRDYGGNHTELRT
jgi:hypothetical protein